LSSFLCVAFCLSYHFRYIFNSTNLKHTHFCILLFKKLLSHTFFMLAHNIYASHIIGTRYQQCCITETSLLLNFRLSSTLNIT
jgi:hypothetical protein